MNQPNKDYVLKAPISPDYAELYFDGKFAGNEVRWHLRLYTLASYFRQSIIKDKVNSASLSIRQFMEVHDSDSNYEVTVALAIPKVDEPSIQKCIVMIRNYRRLRYGRHEWGPIFSLEQLE